MYQTHLYIFSKMILLIKESKNQISYTSHFFTYKIKWLSLLYASFICYANLMTMNFRNFFVAKIEFDLSLFYVKCGYVPPQKSCTTNLPSTFLSPNLTWQFILVSSLRVFVLWSCLFGFQTPSLQKTNLQEAVDSYFFPCVCNVLSPQIQLYRHNQLKISKLPLCY